MLINACNTRKLDQSYRRRQRWGQERGVSAITSPERTGAKVYYQSGPDWYQSGPWRRRSPSAANVHASH